MIKLLPRDYVLPALLPPQAAWALVPVQSLQVEVSNQNNHSGWYAEPDS